VQRSAGRQPPTPALAPVVQRKTYSSSTAKTLLADTAQADVPSKIVSDHGPWLAKATDAERIDLLNACLASGADAAPVAIDLIWFRTANWQALARANPSVWEASLKQLRTQTLKGSFFSNLLDAFLFDTEEVARGYLTMNENYCASSLQEMFYDREGKPMVGPPSAAQQKARENPVDQEAAKDLLALQEKLRATRKIVLGTVEGATYYLPDGRQARKSEPAQFDPAGRPPQQLTPLPGDPPARRWETIKAGYDEGTEAVRTLLSLHPKLYLLVRENLEGTEKTAQVAGDTSPGRANSLALIAKELADTIRNIGVVRPLLGKAVAAELVPIHDQLRAGTTTSPRRPSRNWATDPLWKAAADAYTEYNKPPPWWQTLGLAAAEMAVWVFAGIATGGVGFAVGMAVKGGLEAAVAAGKSQVMTAASLSNVSRDTALVSSQQAEEARTAAIVAAAFAVLDALMIGVELRAAGAAAKLATVPGAQAARAIELSERVLQYEKKLLGRVAASETETAAKEAKALAADARRMATEAKAGGDAGRTRMAEKAADQAEAASKRIDDLATATRRAEQAKIGIPESEILSAFELPLEGGGKLIVSKTGQVFLCASPCSALIDRFADVIARNPALKARATAMETAEKEANSALAGLKGLSAKAVQQRMARLADALRKECERYKQAEAVVQWLAGEAPKYPGLAGKKLDVAAIARVLEKGPRVDGMKGQLLEELGGASVLEMLGTSSGRARLAGEFAAENLVFIPGHRLRDPQGRQLTDGIVGFWKGETFQIVTVIESKAGLWAAEGLRFGEAELSAVRSARHKLMIAAYKRGDKTGAKAIRDLEFASFMKAHKAEVDRALRAAESDSDWAMHAIEDVQEAMVKELRAQGKAAEATTVENLSTSQFAFQYRDKAAEAMELIPLPEAGQFTRDLERSGQLGGKISKAG
jgi:hypothetical protein